MKRTAATALILLCCSLLEAGEIEIMELAGMNIKKGEYYQAVTELKRYQVLYPAGRFYGKSLLMMGKAYFNGGNAAEARERFAVCLTEYPGSPEGEESLYSLGRISLMTGNVKGALSEFLEYRKSYPGGRFGESAGRDMCYAAALSMDLANAEREMKNYHDIYPSGIHAEELRRLGDMISAEKQRGRKSALVSVLGSLVLPGFGHFYTGKHFLGFVTLATNAACGYLIYNGYRNKNYYQLVFFSVVGATFYQYSVYSAVKNVDEYNRGADFLKSVKLSIGTSF